jgi:hypothetical protein
MRVSVEEKTPLKFAGMNICIQSKHCVEQEHDNIHCNDSIPEVVRGNEIIVDAVIKVPNWTVLTRSHIYF